jgi:hypothetical protein
LQGIEWLTRPVQAGLAHPQLAFMRKPYAIGRNGTTIAEFVCDEMPSEVTFLFHVSHHIQNGALNSSA